MVIRLGTIATVFVFLFISCNNMDNKNNDEMINDSFDTTGLASNVNLLAEMPSYSNLEAGKSTKIERAFENAPPMIPHQTTHHQDQQDL